MFTKPLFKPLSAGLTREALPDDDVFGNADAEPSFPKVANGMSPDTRGDEDMIESEEVMDTDDRVRLPEDFYYEYEDHVSKAFVSDESGLPENLLTLQYPC